MDLFVQSEIARAMLDQLIEFLECAIVEQKLDAFARGHLAGRVLLLDARRAAALFGLPFALAQMVELGLLLLFLGRHQLNLKRDQSTTEDTEKSFRQEENHPLLIRIFSPCPLW